MEAVDKKQLWEINDVILNSNYSRQAEPLGFHYSLTTGRTDLPTGFFAKERDVEIMRREEAERVATLSGQSAQNERQAGGTYDPSYQLPSEKIANAPHIKDVLSSEVLREEGGIRIDGEREGGWEGGGRRIRLETSYNDNDNDYRENDLSSNTLTDSLV